MLADDFQDVIKSLKYSADFRIPIPKNDTFQERMLKFIEAVRKDINPTTPSFQPPLSWTFTRIKINATHLLEYREFLGSASLNETQYRQDYLSYSQTDRSLLKGLNGGNPFILHEHLINICNLIDRYKNTPINTELAEQNIFNDCRDQLIELKNKIELLDRDEVGIFKNYLQSLVLAIFSSYFDDNLFRPFFMKETIIATKVAMKYEDSMQDEDSEELAVADFYTCGKPLFDRTPFKSFTELERILSSSEEIPVKEICFCYDKAIEQYQNQQRQLSAEPDPLSPEKEETPKVTTLRY